MDATMDATAGDDAHADVPGVLYKRRSLRSGLDTPASPLSVASDISAASGLVGCQVQRDVYSDNGRVLLIERGSHLDGEYRIASVRPGTVRIPVLWTRIRTPHGVTVDVESPGTGQLGESGIDGHVDNRWGGPHRRRDAALPDRRLGQAGDPEPDAGP